MLRRITYVDPLEGTRYVYLTTEMTLPPGLLVLIYKQRWDIEKVFDELKTKLVEKQAWGSSATAKSTHAQFLCLAHNLMVLLEEVLLEVEGIDNAKERKRKTTRKEKAEKEGANFVATAVQRFTVRSLKFIRWLRLRLPSDFLGGRPGQTTACLRDFLGTSFPHRCVDTPLSILALFQMCRSDSCLSLR